MKKIALIGVLLAACSGCCTVEKKLVGDIEASHAKILPKYLKYVDADATLDAAAKDDEKKFVESLKRVVDSMKKQVE